MQAKRDALYAKLMERKEKVEEAVAEKEAKNAERRMEDQRKQEMVEQKKLEKEMRRYASSGHYYGPILDKWFWKTTNGRRWKKNWASQLAEAVRRAGRARRRVV